MTELKTVIIDASTGEVTERPLNSKELKDLQALQVEQQAQQVEQDAINSVRESALAKLAKLGLTEQEIKALYNG
jgi:3-oxoacyl-[acyl-carrier-protein] synthase III